MKTISNLVENYINNKPYLLTSLSRGIINLTSLAREMQDDLERDLEREVKIGAIVMSLKRLTEEISFKMNLKMEEVLRNLGEITVRSSLSEFTYQISKHIYEKQVLVLKDIEDNTDVFFTSSRGVNELNLVISTTYKEVINKHFTAEKLILQQDNLSSITIKLPEENTKTSGLYYFFFQKLAWEKVIIKEVISTTNEFTLIVGEADVELAFKVINSLKIK